MIDFIKKLVYVWSTYQRAQFVPLVCFVLRA